MSNLQFSRPSGSLRRTAASSALTLCFIGALLPALLAEKPSKSERKVLVSVTPQYSDFLRHAQIGGLVRLKATVTPEGKVTSVDVLGGNPILAESAVTAVMKWKYVPAPAQTVEEISISFNPH